MSHRIFIALALALSLGSASCTTATLVRTNYGRVDARIVDGDEQAVWIVPQGSGEVVRVPRQEIRALEHPGDGWILTGAVLVGLGLVRAGTMGLIGTQGANLTDLIFPLSASMSYVGVGSVLWYTGHQLKESSIQRSKRSVGVGWSTSF